MNIKSLSNGDVAIIILVKPGQKKESVVLGDDGAIVLRINALAQEGKANARVVEYLAKVLGRPKRDIHVARGELSRHKEIRIKNADVEDINKSLLAAARSEGDSRK